MKDLFFGIAMLLAGIFCAILGAEYEFMYIVGGLFAAIGVVVAFRAEFVGGLVKNRTTTKDTQILSF